MDIKYSVGSIQNFALQTKGPRLLKWGNSELLY